MQGAQAHDLGPMCTTDPALAEQFARVRRVAPTAEPVLVLGETGAGKEGVARAVHGHSPRARRPFVAVNCAVLTGDLAAAELFGHERGAFTGADRRTEGVFERARGGTVFLDEIGELTPRVQAQLLRAVETRRVRRVGGDAEIECDYRLVSATHRDLGREVREGRFRSDLFYRIGVIVLEVPPLRARPGDVGLLARRFLHEAAPGAVLSDGAVEALLAEPWPGNVRELRNVIGRIAAEGGRGRIGKDDVEAALGGRRCGAPGPAPQDGPPRTQAVPGESTGATPTVAVGGRPLAAVRRDVIRYEVGRQLGNVARAARVLGVARSTVYEALRAAGDGFELAV